MTEPRTEHEWLWEDDDYPDGQFCGACGLFRNFDVDEADEPPCTAGRTK